MKDWDDQIHRALAHPIRRRIIECMLEKDNLSFKELIRYVRITNHGKLGYHVRALKGLVERDTSKKRYRLTDRGKLAGELLWDTRFIIESGGRELSHEPTRYVRHLRFRDHAVLFYDREYIKWEIAFPFLEAGLSKGEAALYLVAESKVDSEIREAQKCGINVEWFRKGAFTLMSADEWFMEKGKAEAETIIANWLRLLEEKRKAGFAGLRIAEEADIFFNYAKREELFRYEVAFGKELQPNLCALCLYFTDPLDEEQRMRLEKCHGHSISKDLALKIV